MYSQTYLSKPTKGYPTIQAPDRTQIKSKTKNERPNDNAWIHERSW